MNQHLKFSLETMDAVSCRLKRRRIQFVISRQLKSLHLWRSGVALVSMVQAADTSGKAPPMLKITRGFRATSAPIQTTSLSGKTLHMTMLNYKLHPSQQHDFTGEESRCWSGLTPVQTIRKQLVHHKKKKHLLTSQMFRQLLQEKGWPSQNGEQHPVPTILRCVATIKVKMS